MRFTIDLDASTGMSSDGRYSVKERGERYGRFLDISLDGKLMKPVWVRENHRSELPHEKPKAGYADAVVVEWVVDNNAQTGADRRTTLADQVGEKTLSEVLLAYFEAEEIERAQSMREVGRPWPRRLVRIGCRGNQRMMMEDRYGP